MSVVWDMDHNDCFENFVVDSSNQFAYAASLAVAAEHGQAYNPFMIYGDAALGKSHLLNAIRLKIMSQHPALKILYVSAEVFKNDLITAIRFEETSAFRDKYTDIDCLLMDDIQLIAGQERTQEIFLLIFKSLYGMGKQIVITCDQFPDNIPNLVVKRLFRQLEGSLIADIDQPRDIETKRAIVERMAHKLGLKFTIDPIEYPALETFKMKDIHDQLLFCSLLGKNTESRI